jgi:tetratricopeptide (TPR) repeat protein
MSCGADASARRSPRAGALRRAACAAALAALTAGVYAPVRDHEFVDYDDLVYVVANPIAAAGLGLDGLRLAFTRPNSGQWAPLTEISFQIDRAWHGVEPRGTLLGNLALHLAASLALFFGLARMSGADGRSLFVATVFAVHPLHVESVAWASERKDVLCGALWMAALWAHAARAERPTPARGALVTLLGALALLAKPMAVTLPLTLLLLDRWPLRRLGRRSLVEQLPLLALAALVSGVTFAVQQDAGFMGFGQRVPLGARLANAVHSLAVYLAETAWPSGLAAFYPHPGTSLAAGRVAAAAAVLAAITLPALALRRSRPYLLVGWLWYLVTLLPVLGIVQVGPQARADRYTYVPMVGIAILVAFGAWDAARRPAARRVLAVAAGAAVAALAVATRVQVGTWRDSLTLFGRMLEVGPEDPLPHERLAAVYLRAGDLERAEHHYTRMFKLAPDLGRTSLALFQRGMAQTLLARGDEPGALDRYRRALALVPGDPRTRLALARLLAEARDSGLRDPAEALRLAEALCAERPRDPARLDARAGALAVLGRGAEALRDAQDGLEAARAAGATDLEAQLAARVAALRAAGAANPATRPPRSP